MASNATRVAGAVSGARDPQVLGHRRLPEFVGNIDEEAQHRPA